MNVKKLLSVPQKVQSELPPPELPEPVIIDDNFSPPYAENMTTIDTNPNATPELSPPYAPINANSISESPINANPIPESTTNATPDLSPPYAPTNATPESSPINTNLSILEVNSSTNKDVTENNDSSSSNNDSDSGVKIIQIDESKTNDENNGNGNNLDETKKIII